MALHEAAAALGRSPAQGSPVWLRPPCPSMDTVPPSEVPYSPHSDVFAIASQNSFDILDLIRQLMIA